jgi:hypothetical protein
MAYQSTIKFLLGSWWFLGFVQFITDKFGDLTLQEIKSPEIVGSGTGRLPPSPVRVSLINEAQLRYRPSKLGKMDLDLTEDKANHTLVVPVATTYPIY